jgi:putative ATPase
MRPSNFDEFVGQEHIVGINSILRKSIESNQIPSIILWGPPGTGKTTLANIISQSTNSYFEKVSAVVSGVAELRRVSSEAIDRLGMHDQRTILFVDEIHRFNKAQQDVILPYVEDGTLVLIGATTENPSFEIISPLLSRSRVFTLKSLTDSQIEGIIEKALEDHEKGLGALNPKLDMSGMKSIVTYANGDARIALNALELSINATEPDNKGIRYIDSPTVEEAMQQKALAYDKSGDQHFDTISAYIKSIRASDPDAAIYWLARMIEAGEDPMFIARRLVISASEDIGLAEPQALLVAVAAQQAVHFIGMPEGRIPLAEASIYLATAPKSNTAYMALNRAVDDVRHTRNEPVPLHLRNAVTNLMKDMDYGKGYKYAHNHDGNFVRTENLPENLTDRKYYVAGSEGFERKIGERMKDWWDTDSKDNS